VLRIYEIYSICLSVSVCATISSSRRVVVATLSHPPPPLTPTSHLPSLLAIWLPLSSPPFSVVVLLFLSGLLFYITRHSSCIELDIT